MITKTLKEFASPIINKAMASGARGGSVTTTNYGGIGDAMFKKAQMDMNMATLNHEMKSNIINMKASGELKILDTERRYQEMVDRDTAASQDMGDLDKALGTLQGAASGAMAGYAAGGPTGAIVGGVAGGAVAADNYYSGKPGDEKRETGARRQEAMGSIAALSGSLRNMYDSHKGKEAFGKTSKNLADVAQAVSTMGPGQARDQKIQEYNTKSAAASAELSKYYGPQEVNTMMEGLRKGAPAIFSNNPKIRDQALLAQNGVAAAADPLLQSSSPEGRARLKQYHGDNNSILGRLYGSNDNNQMSNQEFSHWAGGVNPALGKEATNMYRGGVSSINAAPPRGGGFVQGGGSGSSGSVSNPTQGRTVAQAPVVSQSGRTIDNSQSYMLNHPGVGGGVAMDDGMGFLRDPMAAIQKTNEMGADAVTALGRGDRGAREDRVRSRIEEEVRNDYGPDTSEGDIREAVNERMTKSGPMNEIGNPRLEEEPVQVSKSDTSVAQKRARGADIDNQVEAKFEELSPYMIDKSDKDAAKNILITKDNLKIQEDLIDRLPADSQAKAKAAEFLLEGLSKGKDKEGLLGSMFLVKGNVATAVGVGALDKAISSIKGGMGKGSATAVSAILSPDEIAAVEEYAQNEAMAIQALVKSGDTGVVNEGEVKHARSIFFNHGMTKERKQERINGIKENMLIKMSNISKTAKPFYKAQVAQDMEVVRGRANEQIRKAGPEGYYRGKASKQGQMDAADERKQDNDGGYFDY